MAVFCLEITAFRVVDLRLEDREAVVLHPENPVLYSKASIVTGGTFSWKLENQLEDGPDGDAE